MTTKVDADGVYQKQSLFRRLRVWVAAVLCRRTDCIVVRVVPAALLHDVALGLARYVEESGALQDPRRVKAYRRVLRDTVNLTWLARNLFVGINPTVTITHEEKEREESHAKEAAAQPAATD